MATSTDLRSAIEEVQGQLPEEQVASEDQILAGEGDWTTRLERRVGALPWWVISAATHAVLFLLVALLATAVATPRTDEVIISTDVVKQKPPEYDPQKKRDIFKNTKDIQSDTQVDNPVVTHEKMEQSDHFETDNNMDKNTSRGSEDAISDIPLGGTGTVGSIGVGGGGMAGVFGYRDGGGRKKAVGRFGGSQATESAVEAALRWLARHQEKDGSWDARKYEATAGGSDNTRIRVGCTGLALLAFLGAGYTEKSGQFADNIKRAEQWLMKQQKASGMIAEVESGGGETAAGYNHACAGLALAEAYGMGRDPEIGKVAQKAVDYSVKLHQVPYGGWRYDAKQEGDTSVTGWFVMQLKSAKIAGLTVDGAGFQGAMKFLDGVTDKEGRACYGPDGNTSKSASMTAVGMVCRQFMGVPNVDPLLVKATDTLIKDLPDWQGAAAAEASVARGDLGFYYWYYGTLAMFQMGGDKWTKWNEKLKPTLVNNQCKGPLPLASGLEDKDGSWDPNGAYIDKYGGRVFTTAVGALTLEVYYRYLPMYAK
jgi:hypothetical protein